MDYKIRVMLLFFQWFALFVLFAVILNIFGYYAPTYIVGVSFGYCFGVVSVPMILSLGFFIKVLKKEGEDIE